MSYGPGGKFRTLLDSAGAAIEGVAKSTTYQSESIEPDEFLFLAVYLDFTFVGASPTMNVALQCSPDGGTTWLTQPDDVNSDSAATIPEISGSGGVIKYWAIPPASNGINGDQLLYRFNFVIAGTVTSITADLAKICLFAPTN